MTTKEQTRKILERLKDTYQKWAGLGIGYDRGYSEGVGHAALSLLDALDGSVLSPEEASEMREWFAWTATGYRK